MSIIRYVPIDPTDLVIAGDTLATPEKVAERVPVAPMPSPEERDALPRLDAAPPDSMWFDPASPKAHVRAPGFMVPMINASIYTQTGAAVGVWSELGTWPTLATPIQSTTRWVLTGNTLDAAGANLPSCRVLVFEWARFSIGEAPLVADVISSAVDGAFSIEVPGPRDYQIVAYLPGSPDVAGVTLHPLTPTQNG